MTLQDFGSLATLLLTVGGAFAAGWKFAVSRPYHRRLEPAVTGTVVVKGGVQYLTVTIRLKNLGLSKVDIQREGSALTVFAAMMPTLLPNARSLEWEHLGTYDVLTAHQFIESGESIDEQQLIAIPPTDHPAFKLELFIASRDWEWSTMVIVIPDSDNNR